VLDSNAINDYSAINMATIIIRNLDEEVKRQLRLRGAQNGRSMEAEARAILANGVLAPLDLSARPEPTGSEKDTAGPFDHLLGKWEGRVTTDDLMHLTRGED
jgi:hypothetical protein